MTRIEGVVQGLFTDSKTTAWAVYDDSVVKGKMYLDISHLPEEAMVLDMMGNDLKKSSVSKTEITELPMFVLSSLPLDEFSTYFAKSVCSK